ncbi:hypothetical protein [Actinocorallia aurantiaca]|uniref:hypothetical protein n=1 Tax=Actinocorallia aurantiaca TaxID=46204 RepID=UPI0031DCCB36
MQVLSYHDQAFINFRGFAFDSGAHGFRWVDIKCFRLSMPDTDDMTLLRSLIGQEQFRDDYAGGGVDAEGIRHGPYWVDRIGVDDYVAVTNSTAVDALASWARLHGSVPDALNETLELEVFAPLRQATSSYQLKELARTSLHDWGGVHTEFHEFVSIDRMTHRVLLIVAADD